MNGCGWVTVRKKKTPRESESFVVFIKKKYFHCALMYSEIIMRMFYKDQLYTEIIILVCGMEFRHKVKPKPSISLHISVI